MAKYAWYIKTTEFSKLLFYYTDDNVNPLQSDDLFSSGDCWSLDCAYETNGFYPEDPEENSFVLIPKKDVIHVWSETNFTPPTIINMETVKL